MTGFIQQNDAGRMVIHVSASPDLACLPDLAYLYDRLIDLVARRVFGVTDRVLSAFTFTMTCAAESPDAPQAV